MLSIGELSRRAEVKVPTIRYYETTGLLPEPERSPGGQRRYGKSDLERLRFIRHARDLGLKIDDIRQLILLGRDPDQCCQEADLIVRRHLDAVDARITQLTRLKAELERISTQCRQGRVGDCYVMQSLADHGLCETDHD